MFTRDALAILHEATGGAHPDIDRLATAVLRTTARAKRTLVERDAISRVLDAEATGAA